jgi:hypothetical protein
MHFSVDENSESAIGSEAAKQTRSRSAGAWRLRVEDSGALIKQAIEIERMAAEGLNLQKNPKH